MSISPATRFVFALAVGLLSAAPVAARANEAAAPLVWALASAEMAPTPGEGPDAGPGGLAPVVAASTCNAEINGDNITDFSSVDAQALRDALAAVAANGTVKIAGYCSGVASQGGTIQTALITKTSTLAGGYTTTDWTSYNPLGNPTTLDALQGGRVIVASVDATLRGFTLTGGYISSAVDANGGGINAVGALTLSEMIVSGNTITGTASQLYGGGAYIGGPASVFNTTFSNNSASKAGGGLYAFSTLALSNAQFLSNTATAGSGGGGGGLFAQSTLALTDTQFLGNTTTTFGGGAFAGGAATLTGGVFRSNAASSRGGGLFAQSTLALTGTQFLSNTAANQGGGAYASGAATLTGGVFQNNTSGNNGGGLHALSTLALTGMQFLSNTATSSFGSGGGAHASGATTLIGGVFRNNAAANGGGLNAVSTLALTGTQFLSNTAANSGGGANANGAATLNDAVFQNNRADNRGGGLYLSGATAKRVVNALFARNAATANGAAIYVANAGPLSLIHTSIVSPTAPTGAPQAIYVVTGTVYLSNTLIATHTLGIGVAGGTVGDRNTLFAGVTTPYTGTVTSVGGITGTAGFVNPAADDYHLGAGSAAINAGINASVYTDFEGDVRPQGGGFDIGYDEKLADPTCFATPNEGATVFSSADAKAVRDALAVVLTGTVKVAGYCSGVATQGGTIQTALITQTITLAGGYTTTDWTTYNPAGNPTTLDALQGGRVIVASVDATLRGFTVTGGYINSALNALGGGINTSGALTLSDMIVSGNTVTGTASVLYGGGAYIGGEATVANTSFSNNAAQIAGGGLYALSTLALSGTQFIRNTTSSTYGGGAVAQGAATLNGGLFQNNSGPYGGGLAVFATLALSGTQFLSNTAATFAGGAYIAGATTLNGGVFQNNRAGVGGGGGLYAQSTLALSGTQFLSNTAASYAGGVLVFGATTLNGGVFQSNRAGTGGGGGLYAATTLALTGTQFLGNTAGSQGGGLYLEGGNAKRVVNALFARNAAALKGAAIYVDSAAPLSLIHTSIVSPTEPTGATQAIYVAAGTVYLSNTLIATHTIGIARAGGTVGDWNTLFAGVSAPYSGTVTSAGGITGTAGFVNPAADDYHLGAGSAAINAGIDAGVYTDFEGDVRPQGGGFDIGYDEGLAVAACFATPNDGTTVFSSADAKAVRDALAVVLTGTVKVAGYCSGVATQGGTIQTALITQTITLAGGYTTTDWTSYNPAGNPTTLDALLGGRVISAPVAATLRGFTVTGGYISSTVDADGGGINAAGALTLSEMIVSGNTITGAETERYYGGGAYASGAANVSNTTFSNNYARTHGGGLYTNATLALSGTQFLSNTAATSYGGGAYASGAATLNGGLFQNNSGGFGGGLYTNATLALSGTQFLSNTATYYGGGAYASGAATLNGGVFQSNSARIYGGGLAAFSTLVLTGTQFLSNTATSYGGGAYADGAATLNGGLFQNNTAGNGGGGLVAFSTLALTGTQFISNTASNGSGVGGGAFAVGAATLNGGLFQNNSATYGGGGLAAYSTLALTGTQFLGNMAGALGGGLYLDTANAKRVVNALFARNTATANGAAIYVSDAAPLSLIHTTIASPTAPTGAPEAVYVAAGTVYLTNTLIATHTLGIGVAGGTVGDWNTLFDSVSNPYSGTVTSVGGITGTAGFVNPAADDYHLGAGSAAVDAGIDAGVYTDFDGDVRPQSGGFDIGYDELSTANPTWLITATAGLNGSIVPSGTQIVADGGSITFTITPATGYRIADVGVDGVSQGAQAVYTFTNVTAAHTITAAFAINTYTLTMTTTAFVINSNTPTVTTPGAGSAGITPTVGANLFGYGTVVTLTAVALPAWTFVGWTGDPDCSDGVVTVTADLTCAARFETRIWYFPRMFR